jgi:polyphosphate kinase 2
MINNYGEFLNEDLKKEFTKLLHNIRSYFDSQDDIEKLETDLIRILTSYKNKIMKGEIRKIDKALLQEIEGTVDRKVVEELNIDTFFRGINNLMLKGKEKKIDVYFNDYISTIPKRLKIMYNQEQNIDIKDTHDDIDTEDVYYDPYLSGKEFDEWRKVVAEAPRFRMKRNRFEIEKAQLHIELLHMLEWLKSNNKKLIIVLEGRDAAGKGSFIKSAVENLPPNSYRINTFGIPSDEEKKNWFKRYLEVLPSSQQIAFYDRSWYNRAVVEPVMGYCTTEQYKEFMQEVLPFEYKMIDSGYYLIKFWFSITDSTQKIRFKLRQTSPLKYWKFSPNDAKAMEKWDAFSAYKEEMFRKTSTEKSPWIIVDSNDKRFAKLNAMRYILNQIPYENKKEEILQVFPEIVYPIL